MRVVVKFFAILRDRAGISEITLDVPQDSTVATTIKQIAERFPETEKLLAHIAFAVNRVYAPASTVLKDGDELALIPAVSGG